MSAKHSHDPGLHAVARVRGVRERDSRIGLQQALRVTAQREADAVQAQAQLDGAAPFVQGTSAQFHAQRAALAALAAQVQRSLDLAAASRATTDEARRRWQHDRTRRGPARRGDPEGQRGARRHRRPAVAASAVRRRDRRTRGG